ncbi:MAG: sugar ABC transporter ATP-binding protein [Caldilinea sp.]|nr:sugar ABC transporter ATP-binding protein [Caldilineaceae bacterium]MCB0149569.1 sugar ABC transporter ATP-binding protein [Caldilineaceae bacterium]MCB9116127.1 sugar ABC transporter ATP-binding protein [Caldilineaceae bacterium]MCB9118922.1 sugar ABC transporter ATP-binding protein [Caldilineaceae bacterium]MCO5208722.1 sugar ABC transporter ATP-binding protein [Caldilinea sp.]
MDGTNILEFVEISKGFPGVQALDRVSFAVRRGEVHAIVGENGAGKSTLMKIIAGLYQPDGGEIHLDGKPVVLKDAHRALGLGIAMVPQELNLIPEMSVAENILLGMEPHNSLGVVDRNRQLQRAGETLASLGLEGVNLGQRVKGLSVAQQQMLQIARALAFQCNVLIMDEPTASLSEREQIALFERLRMLHEKGTTILYISHRMEEVFDISDRITVLRDGKFVGTLPREEATQDEVVRMMIGSTMADYLHGRSARLEMRRAVLEVRDLGRQGHFHEISFDLHQGEILGFAGLVGAGRTELLGSIFGALPRDTGDVRVNGQPATIHHPADAIKAGLGYVPEERKRLGIFPELSVLTNTTIPFLRKLQRMTVIDRRAERQSGEQLARRLRVQTPSLEQRIVKLSGGNQQKVILSRWLGSGADILILDEPTRGIDINAKAEIHALIAELADEGKSIIMISSEIQELLAICDRILVMRNGAIVSEVSSATATQEDILRLAMFGSEATLQPANPKI